MKKKFICFFIFLIIIISVIAFFIFIKPNHKKTSLLNKKDEFVINKILYYSSANAISNTTNYQNPEWNLKVFQYTDIAIYLDRLNDVSDNNYITSMKISNPKLSSQRNELYYINPKLVGKNILDLDSKIENELEYTVINDENEDNSQNYNIPIFFQDLSNPITLRFVNYLADSYKVSSDKNLIYNGSLISELGLGIEDLDSNLSFDLTIALKSGETRTKNIEIEIPFEKGSKSILDGDFTTKVKQDIRF